MNLLPTTDRTTQAIYDALATLLLANGGSGTGITLDATSSLGGVTGTTLAADHAAWTAFTPTFGGISAIGTGGVLAGAYKQIGKTLFLRAEARFGTTPTVSSFISLTLPNGLTSASSTNQSAYGVAFQNSTAFRWRLVGDLASSATQIYFSYSDGVTSLLAAGSPITWASGDRITVQAMLEVA